MKKLAILCASAAILMTAMPAFAAPEIGSAAPDFEGVNVLDGQPFKLSDHKGKTVVLEWTNHQCPFVVKHYETGNMQKIQKEARAKGVEWVSIVSSAPGAQGHTTASDAAALAKDAGADITAKIMDESGEIGKKYDAQTTPHMFVINAEGNLVYAGAIDNDSSPRHEAVETATNYVTAALADIEAGRAVQTPTSAPYGCGVKYAK